MEDEDGALLVTREASRTTTQSLSMIRALNELGQWYDWFRGTVR